MKRLLIFTCLLAGLLFVSCGQNTADSVSGAKTGSPCPADSFPYPSDLITAEEDNVHTCVSEDGKMKFYCWNTGNGGTCPDYAVVCQIRTADGKYRVVDTHEDEMPAWIRNLHAVQKDDGSIFYIAERSHPASSAEYYSWLEGFAIDHDTLKNVNPLDGGECVDNPSLSIGYCDGDWYYATNGEGWDWLFEYDAETKSLYVPECISESLPGYLTDRYHVYKFDGQRFVSQGVQPHKGLHKSLSEYQSLEYCFRTANHYVRIDRLADGKLRYAQWKASASISSPPELVLIGGSKGPKQEMYTFENQGTTYLVNVNEQKLNKQGEIVDSHDFLIVKKDGKNVLKEERLMP